MRAAAIFAITGDDIKCVVSGSELEIKKAFRDMREVRESPDGSDRIEFWTRGSGRTLRYTYSSKKTVAKKAAKKAANKAD